MSREPKAPAPVSLPALPALRATPVPLREKVQQLLEEGDRETAGANFEAALGHYRAALALGHDGEAAGDQEPGVEARLLVHSARCLLRLGRTTEALRAVEAAATAPAPAGPAGAFLELEVALQWAEIYVELGDYRRAEGHARDAMTALESMGHEEDEGAATRAAWAGRLHNLLGHTAARRGDLDGSEREFGRAIAFFRRAGDLAGLATAFNNMGLTCKNRCQWARARDYFTVSERLRSEGEESSPHGASLLNLGIVHFKLGEWADAARRFEESRLLSVERGDVQNQVRALLALGRLHCFQREFAAAEEVLHRAVVLAETHQFLRELALGLAYTGELAAARHHLSDAQEHYARAGAIAARIAPDGDLVAEVARLEAELALALGDGVSSAERVRAALALARRQGDPYEEALSQAVHAKTLDLLGESERAREAHRSAVTRLRQLGARRPLAVALVAYAAHLRNCAPEERDQARLLLREAAACVEGGGSSLDPALIQLEAARLEMAAGHLDSAGDLLARAREGMREAADERGLESLHHVEAELEEALVNRSLAARGVAGRARGEAVVDLPTAERMRDEMLAVVEGMTETSGVDGAFLAVRRAPAAQMELLARCGVPEPWAQDLLADLPARFEETMGAGVPTVVLDASRDGGADLPRRPARQEVGSFLVVPLELSDGAQGFLYVERRRVPGAPSLGQKDLHFALAVTEELAMRVTEMGLREKSDEGMGLREKLSERVAFANVVTQNRELLEVMRLVSKVSATRMTVLIQGETGTGKQLIARAIHASSDRRDRPFVTIDCAALPENLLESELFGYRRGAFTGATSDRKGLAEEADGGTIFLDEIGKAGIGAQQRLLHLLDCGEIRAVGATSYRQLDVRIISATSTPDLRREVEEGRFLKDLYYRLNDFAVVVPPLRERREDVLLLAGYFLELFANECRRATPPELTRPALRLLLEYDWPGNVRELQKVMRRAAVLAEEGEPITPDLLPPEIRQPDRGARGVRGNGAGDSNGDGDPAASGGKLHEAVEEFERRLILATLEKVGWNKSRAADELGLSRKGLRNKIARMDLARHEARGEPAERGPRQGERQRVSGLAF